MAGDERAPGNALFVFAAALAGLGARLGLRRRRASKRGNPTPVSAPQREGEALPVPGGKILRRALGCVAAVTVLSSWAGCSCGNNNVTQTGSTTSGSTSSSGGYECDAPGCTTLQPGLIGEYTSVAVSGTNIWVAGYSEADWANGLTYGDLVARQVGRYEGRLEPGRRRALDPRPVDPEAVQRRRLPRRADRARRRRRPLDSIAVGANGQPAIAYYDRTNTALKFAQFNGKQWSSQTVDSGMMSDVGRYAKMLFLNGAFVSSCTSPSRPGARTAR